MTFDEKLTLYAKLLVRHGLNVQPGQIVNINTEVIHRDFAMLLAEQSYEAGAKYVNVDLSDPRLARTRILASNDEDLQYVPGYVSQKYRELVDETAANIKIIGLEYPDMLADLEPKKVNAVRLANHMAVKYFYEEGIGKSKVHWTVAAASTPSWGKRIFPDLDESAAHEALWEEIFKICRADSEDCLDQWKDHNTVLQARGQKLTDLKIKELHFTGPGTDLVVGLSEKAVFKGGSDESPRGVEFEPNIPTEEVFTTPDARVTRGNAKATRPFLINGKLIKGLTLEFTDGKVSNFTAEEGAETFGEYISSDENACRLGEVALVGIDSPIFKSNLVFEEILFDENAACHIAVGSAYKFCLDGGATMSKEELEAVGCNESTVHTDMMISNENVDVVATTYGGETITLIKGGNWADF